LTGELNPQRSPLSSKDKRLQQGLGFTISEIAVNPSNTSADPGTSSTRGYRIETSTDGTTFTPLIEGVF
jgi:hypothetical protein